MTGFAEGRRQRPRIQSGRLVVFSAKLAISVLCIWYLARSIDVIEFRRAVLTMNVRLALLSAAVLMLEIPLVGLRWCRIVDALGGEQIVISRAPMIAITAVGSFFAQVVPNIAADSVRVWMLARLGRSWRLGAASVIIDRGIALAAMIAIGFVALLLPSALAALGGRRNVVVEIFGLMLAFAAVGLVLSPRLADFLELWRYSTWLAKLARAAHRVLLGSGAGLGIIVLALLVHGMTIVSIWLLGRAVGLALPANDAAVLFTVILGAVLIPISISGWGVRELAVTSLLTGHGVPLEQALFFSVCFGLVLLVSGLPGAAVWAFYSPVRLPQVVAVAQ